jgi:thiol-disulfide isomerase/thioredoxin
MNFLNNLIGGGNSMTGNSMTGNRMASIVSYISKMNRVTLAAIVGAIILIVVALVYYFYIMPKSKPNYSAVEGFAQDKSAELLFFYADWCPHCKTAKPAWAEIVSKYENKTINGYKVQFTEINCTTETDEIGQIMNKYKIEGFPTLKLLKDGQIIEYDAKPTKETLDEFLNTVL